MKKNIIGLIIFYLCAANPAYSQKNSNLRMFFNEPASMWEESIPLGNGRLGMMPDGGIHNETIVLNDITLWSGAPQDANNYDAKHQLPEIRRLLIQGKNDEAEALINRSFVCQGEGSGRGNGANVPFGCYQVVGNLNIEMSYPSGQKEENVSAYKRSLSLDSAIARTSYRMGDVTYEREYFTSFSTDVGVIRFSSDKNSRLNFKISLDRPEQFHTKVLDRALSMSGQLNNGTDRKGMKYEVLVVPKVKGGKVVYQNSSISINNATEVILYVSIKTDFNQADFLKVNHLIMKEALSKKIETEIQAHTRNYKKMFDRVFIDLGGSEADSLATDIRLKSFYEDPSSDHGMPVLFYQFGRYLTISSTRPGLLPPNLQGLWAKQIQTPWNGDYHLDVNVQMNHWPVEVSNLSELNVPLADFVSRMVEPGKRTARAYYDADGWVAHVITNVWGYTAPGEDASWGATTSGSGWLCNNLWDHFAFTNDQEYLKKIYPVLKGSADFYKSFLIRDPKTGWLVTAPSVSPENSFVMPNGKHVNVCMGPTIDAQITRELFSNVITAGELLTLDKEYRDTLQSILKDLPPVGRIGSDGRLMEWLEEYEEADKKHRHISHLYGLYPASLITPNRTPELIDACRKTLEVRGDDSPGWSKAYKLLFWARLHDGNRAYKLFKELLMPTRDTLINYDGGGGIYPNMFSAGPPFQIDGNFGGAAGFAEMLLQSHDGYIDLLPAIPDEWKNYGKVKGLKARGNFELEFEWKNGEVVNYNIYSDSSRKVKVKVNKKIIEITTKTL